MPKSYRQQYLEEKFKNLLMYNDLGQKFDPSMPDRGWQDRTTQAGIARSNEIMDQTPPLRIQNNFRGPNMSVNPDLPYRGGYQPASVNTIKSIIDSIADKYLPGDEEFKKVLHAIALAESGGNPLAVGDQGNSIGLFQNNMKAGRGKGHTREQLEDPVYNTELAVQELIQYYNEAKAKGYRGPQMVAYVSKYGQRPAAGLEQDAARRYGEYVSDTPYQAPARTGGFEDTVGRFMAALTPSAYASEEQPSALPKSSELIAGNKYTVKKNDTLWDIANKYLGSGQRWKELVGYSGDPRKMPIGTQITIPQSTSKYTAPTPQERIGSYFSPNTVGGFPTAPKSAVSKYFEPNNIGGFKLPEPQQTPAPKIPAPTPAYFAKKINPISKYFQTNTLGGFSYGT